MPPGRVLPPEEHDSPGRSRHGRTALTLLVLLAVVLLLDLDTAVTLPRSCPWYLLTGADCPFCGLVRSLVAAGDLRFGQSLSLHPFGLPVLVAGIAWLALSAPARFGLLGEAGYIMIRTVLRPLLIAGAVSWLAWWLMKLA